MSQGANTLGTFAIQGPDELEKLHARATVVYEAGESWETRAEAVRAASSSILQDIQKEMSAFEQEASDHQAQLEAELQELNGLVDTAKDHARVAFGQVGASVQELATNLAEVKGHIDAGQTALKSKFDEIQQVIEPFEQAVRQQQEQVLTAMAGVEEVAATLSDGIQGGKEIVAQHIQQLVESLSTAKEEASTHLETAEEQISTARESLGEKLTEIAGIVESQSMELSDATKQLLEEKLQTLIKDAVGELTSVVDNLGSKMNEASEKSSASREVLKPFIDEVNSHLEPIQQLLASAQNATAKVGISWG
jgi:methyl-accepting chemotaxis protein